MPPEHTFEVFVTLRHAFPAPPPPAPPPDRSPPPGAAPFPSPPQNPPNPFLTLSKQAPSPPKPLPSHGFAACGQSRAALPQKVVVHHFSHAVIGRFNTGLNLPVSASARRKAATGSRSAWRHFSGPFQLRGPSLASQNIPICAMQTLQQSKHACVKTA